jgi:hypothetical protein
MTNKRENNQDTIHLNIKLHLLQKHPSIIKEKDQHIAQLSISVMNNFNSIVELATWTIL